MKRTTALLAALLVAGAAAAEPEVGRPAPAFSLADLDGKTRALSDFKGKLVVLEWTNYGCPFVKKHYGSGNMQALQKKYTAKGVVWLSICSSADGKQGSMTAAEWKAALAEKKAAPTAVLPDRDGAVGHLYGAKTTPHMFVVDPTGVLIYKGAIDDTPSTDQADVKTAKNYVRLALDEALAGKPVSVSSTQSYGCSVKYKD